MGGVNNRDATGNGTDGILIWGADFRVANDGVGLPVYQRVNTTTDYDTTGFPLYLRFDGTDDSMATGSISFTSTDKMTLFGGMRKLNDATAIPAELSFDAFNNAGSFAVITGSDTGVLGSQNGYTRFSKGNIAASVSQVAQIVAAAPDTAVTTSTHDILGDLSTIRRNTVAGTSATANQGTGNFGNYPLYIGSRGGSSFRFNGRIYSLIVRGAASTAQQISDTETWVNGKTKAYA
jgi:hypothetical protein